MVNFTSNTYQMKREILSFSKNFSYLILLPTNKRFAPISIIQIQIKSYDIIRFPISKNLSVTSCKIIQNTPL